MSTLTPTFGDKLVARIRTHLRSIGKVSLSAITADELGRMADEEWAMATENVLTVDRFVYKCEDEAEEYMSTTGYTKLFGTIMSSTIWQEPKETKVLWITMLAMADRDGRVDASIPGLANIAGLTIPETETALKTLLSPDPYSRTKVADGRRIEEVPGGWVLINHGKYRDMMSVEARREYLRRKQQEYRAKDKAEHVSTNVSDGSTKLTHSEADSEAEAKADTEKRILARKPRERNVLMDSLAGVCGIPLGEIAGNASLLAKAIKSIRLSTPDVSHDEILRRASNYKTHMPTCLLTPQALAKHWSLCHAPKDGTVSLTQEANDLLNAF